MVLVKKRFAHRAHYELNKTTLLRLGEKEMEIGEKEKTIN